MQKLLVCVLAMLALAQAYTVICPIDVVITGDNTNGYENCCCVNSVTITNNALIHTINFPSISKVFGPVIIENNPNLETITWRVDQVDGSISIQNNAYLYGFPPILQNIGGDIIIANNDQLTTAPLSSLLNANGLSVHDNPHLTTVEAPLLTSSMQSALTIQNNALLTTFSVPQVAFAYTLTVTNNPLLTTLTLTALNVPNSVTVTDNAALPLLELPALTSMQYALTILNNPLLTTANVPLLNFADSVHVSNNGLYSVSLPALTQTENDITIQDNPSLMYVEMPNLVTCYGYVYITGNFNGNTMAQYDFLALNYFAGWSSQPVYSFTSCNDYLEYYYGAYCPTAQAVAAKPAMYPAIQEKKKTKQDFFEAKLKLAAKANTLKPAPK